MNDKKRTPLPTQILGIIWISVGLLVVAAVAFFSHKVAPEPVQNDSTVGVERQKLSLREDSVYRERYQRPKYQSNRVKSKPMEKPSSDTNCYAPTPTPARRQALVVDLNTADSTTLMLLHGIGPVYASRIVRYRERLGGFVSSHQLLEVYGFTPSLLDHIAPHLTIDTTAIRRIDINTVTLKQLVRHPYIEYYQARDIVRLRDRGLVFRTEEDLRSVPSMADSTLQRILPYIEFKP